MSIGSTNLLSKDYLDYASIGTSVIEALTNISDDEDNLEVENDLLNKLSKQPASVVDKAIDSAAHVMDQKSISSDMLSKICRIYRENTERTLDVTSQKLRRNETPSLSRNCPTNDRTLRHNTN